MKFFLLIVFAFAFALAIPNQLNYQVNQEFVFNVNGYLDAKGALVNSQDRTSGSFSTMNGTLAIQCIQVNSDNYMFVMNMFDVVVGVGQGEVASENKPMNPPGSGDTPLGYDMYYQQFFNGSIPQIWYNTADSPYYVNVKIGAINSLQTKVVAPAAKELVTFSDPIGVHTSMMAGASSSNFLILQNTFDQSNFNEFSDQNVHPNMVLLTAETVTQVHPDGYIYGSTVNQYVNMVDMSPAGAVSNRRRKRTSVQDDQTGFNMDLSSKGSLSIGFAGVSSVASQQGRIKNVFSTIEQLQNATDYSSGSLTSVARVAIQQQRKLSAKVDIVALVNKAISIPQKQRESSYFKALSAVVNHLKEYESDLSLLQPFFTKFSNPTVADTMFYVLSRVGSEACQMLICQHGLMVAKEEIQMSALFASSSIEVPSKNIMQHLTSLVASTNEKLASHSLYALTNLVKKSTDEVIRAEIKTLLLNRLMIAVKHRSVTSCLSTLLAIKNAGGSFFIQRHQIPYNLLISLNHISINTILSQLYPYSSVATLPNAFSFPFNRSFDESKKLGGSVASLTFGADLFAGSNFDCNQPTFNYEAYAEATADGSLFGVGFQAIDAKAIYGKANGVVVGDSMFLEVFGKTIFSYQFPVLDCNMHTYPIAHSSPGFSLSYTVWVSIIPITFSASTDLNLNLQWGWEICDSPLLLEVELVPSATLVFSGNAVIDLLILRAGIVLDASFNSQLIPQGKVLGSECSLEFDVNWVSTPMSSSFDAYYEWKQCKYLIFDCHWGVHHQTQIWGWTEPSHNEVVLQETIKIANTKN